MQLPVNPAGVKPMVLAGCMEYPSPVAEKCAVIPPTVRVIGRVAETGALSKSNRTAWAWARGISTYSIRTGTSALFQRADGPNLEKSHLRRIIDGGRMAVHPFVRTM